MMNFDILNKYKLMINKEKYIFELEKDITLLLQCEMDSIFLKEFNELEEYNDYNIEDYNIEDYNIEDYKKIINLAKNSNIYKCLFKKLLKYYLKNKLKNAVFNCLSDDEKKILIIEKDFYLLIYQFLKLDNEYIQNKILENNKKIFYDVSDIQNKSLYFEIHEKNIMKFKKAILVNEIILNYFSENEKQILKNCKVI